MRRCASRELPPRLSPSHLLPALNGLTGARVDWADFKGLNEWERKALELAEERHNLSLVRLSHQRCLHDSVVWRNVNGGAASESGHAHMRSRADSLP